MAQNEPTLPPQRPRTGNVTNQVAKESGVSIATVKRAVESKKLIRCERCERLDIDPKKNPDCPACAELKTAKQTSNKPKPKSKSGSVIVNWKEVRRHFGYVVRLIVSMRDHYKGKVTAGDLNKYDAATNTIATLIDQWQKEVAVMDGPKSPDGPETEGERLRREANETVLTGRGA